MKGARFIRCKRGSNEPVQRCRFIPIYNRVNLEPEPEPTKIVNLLNNIKA
jgi:hypothetical protein